MADQSAMFDKSKPFTFDRVVRMILTAAVFIALFLLVRYLRDVLIPFVAAVVIAYILNPVVVAFERRLGLKRGRAVALTLVGGGVIGFCIVLMVVLVSVQQVQQFDDSWRNFRATAVEWIAARQATSRPTTSSTEGDDDAKTRLGLMELWEELGQFLHAQDASLTERLDDLDAHVTGTATGVVLHQAIEFVRDNENPSAIFMALYDRLAAGGVTIKNLTVELFVGVTALILVLVYLIFILLDYPKYRSDWRNLLPPEYSQHVLGFLSEFDAVLRRYFRGQLVIAMCVGVMFAIGFSLIGLPMAVPFGLLVGALNMVPYLQIVAIVPAIGLVLLQFLSGQGDPIWTLIFVAMVFVVVQLIQDTLLTPKIMGKAVGLSPVAVLLGVFIWGKLLGFLGLLLAIPLTCLGIAYYRRLVLRLSEAETSLAAEPAS